MEKEVFFVFWLSFKNGRKQLSSCTYSNRCSAVDAAKYAISMYDGLGVLSDDFPFYVACYEY